MRRVEREDRELTRHAQDMTQQVHARYDAMVKWACRARDQLLEDASAREDSARSQLRAETTSTTTAINTLSSLVSRAARATASSDVDMVVLRNELKTALLSEDIMQHHRRRADREEPLWGWQYHVTDVFQQEDVTAHMGRMVNSDQGDFILPVTSLRELSARMDRWMNEVTETTNTMTSELATCKQKLTEYSGDVSTMKVKEADLEKKMKSLHDDVKKSETAFQTHVKSSTTDVKKLEETITSVSKDLTILKRKEADLQRTALSLSEKIGELQRGQGSGVLCKVCEIVSFCVFC